MGLQLYLFMGVVRMSVWNYWWPTYKLRMKSIKKKENTGYAVWTCSLLPWIKPCLKPTFGLT